MSLTIVDILHLAMILSIVAVVGAVLGYVAYLIELKRLRRNLEVQRLLNILQKRSE